MSNKWKRGRKIRNVDQFLTQEYVIFDGDVKHLSELSHMDLDDIAFMIEEGRLYMVKPRKQWFWHNRGGD